MSWSPNAKSKQPGKAAIAAPAVVAAAASPRDPAQTCFGLTCPLRRNCARYLAVDSAPGESTMRVTCLSNGAYPAYLNASQASPINAHAAVEGGNDSWWAT
jgi:hypothetical protein